MKEKEGCQRRVVVEEFVIKRDDGIRRENGRIKQRISGVVVPKYGGLQAKQNGSVYDRGGGEEKLGKVD